MKSNVKVASIFSRDVTKVIFFFFFDELAYSK